MAKIRLLVIDQKMNSVDVEMEDWQFKNLGIKAENIKKHSGITALKKDISAFFQEDGKS